MANNVEPFALMTLPGLSISPSLPSADPQSAAREILEMSQRGGRPSCLAAQDASIPHGKSVWVCEWDWREGGRERRRREHSFNLSENKWLKTLSAAEGFLIEATLIEKKQNVFGSWEDSSLNTELLPLYCNTVCPLDVERYSRFSFFILCYFIGLYQTTDSWTPSKILVSPNPLMPLWVVGMRKLKKGEIEIFNYRLMSLRLKEFLFLQLVYISIALLFLICLVYLGSPGCNCTSAPHPVNISSVWPKLYTSVFNRARADVSNGQHCSFNLFTHRMNWHSVLNLES